MPVPVDLTDNLRNSGSLLVVKLLFLGRADEFEGPIGLLSTALKMSVPHAVAQIIPN